MTLVANGSGVVTGKFTIPAGLPSGGKRVTFTGGGGQYGEAVFSGQGTLERQTYQQQTSITETRWQSPPPPPPVAMVEWQIPAAWQAPMVGGPPFVNLGPVFDLLQPGQTFIGEGTGFGGSSGGSNDAGRGDGRSGSDPIAQTFSLGNSLQTSGVDVWFAVAPTTLARVQIRHTTAGFPNQQLVAEATLPLGSISVGGVATRVLFPRPVTLLSGVEYAIVVLCNDAVGEVSVAEIGKFDSTAQHWVTDQPYSVGVLLSSSNASTWTAHQDRDLTFRLLGAAYSETTRTVALGNVAVTAATDLMLMAFSELPAGMANVQYKLTLPDASVLNVSDGEPVQLAAAVTGDIAVSAVLNGTINVSPALHPGSQLVAGVVASTGTYVSRAIPGGTGVTAKVVFEAFVPSGATVTVHYKGPDFGDTWISVPQTASVAVDDGFFEFTHVLGSITETSVQIRLTLAGTTAARPRVRDLRCFVL